MKYDKNEELYVFTCVIDKMMVIRAHVIIVFIVNISVFTNDSRVLIVYLLGINYFINRSPKALRHYSRRRFLENAFS